MIFLEKKFFSCFPKSNEYRHDYRLKVIVNHFYTFKI